MPTAPRWQRLERDERREQILACARRLFSERSYATVSTSEIAAAAGVARGLLHHYFGTKRELYLEVVRTMVGTPPTPIPRAGSGEHLEAAIGEAADRWLSAHGQTVCSVRAPEDHVASAVDGSRCGIRRPGACCRPRTAEIVALIAASNHTER
jgi:AcrR family transcriptional regulator